MFENKIKEMKECLSKNEAMITAMNRRISEILNENEELKELIDFLEEHGDD